MGSVDPFLKPVGPQWEANVNVIKHCAASRLPRVLSLPRQGTRQIKRELLTTPSTKDEVLVRKEDADSCTSSIHYKARWDRVSALKCFLMGSCMLLNPASASRIGFNSTRTDTMDFCSTQGATGLLGVVVTRRRCDLTQGWGRGAIASLIASSCTAVTLSLGHLHRDTGNVANAELRDQSVPYPAESSCVNPMLVTIKSEAKERDRTAYRKYWPPGLNHFKADNKSK